MRGKDHRHFQGAAPAGPARRHGNNIQFHVKTRVPLDYTGTVDGNTMKGTMSARGKTGNWTGARANWAIRIQA